MAANLAVSLVSTEFLRASWVECACLSPVTELDDGDEPGSFSGASTRVARRPWSDSLLHDSDSPSSPLSFVSSAEADWLGYSSRIFTTFGVPPTCRGRIRVTELCVWYTPEATIVGCCDSTPLETIEFAEFLGATNHLGIIIVRLETANPSSAVPFCFPICLAKHETAL